MAFSENEEIVQRHYIGHFAFGGKDGTPYFPKPEEMDKTISIFEKGILKSQASLSEKTAALKRLKRLS